MSPEEMLARITKRVKMMSPEDLLSWADMAASGMQRQLDEFRRDPVEDHLAEIKLAALSMDAVVDELGERLRQTRERS